MTNETLHTLETRLPNYILMELWMIWNMVPYLWYRLVVVRFDLK